MLIALLCPWLAEHTRAAGAIEPYEGSLGKPGFSLQDTDHRLHSLTDYRDKVILVNFWASWCVPCIKEMPGIQRTADTLRDRPFVILAINIAEPQSRIQKFLKSMGINFKVLLDKDGSTFKAWQGCALPTSFLLDPEGRIRYRLVSPIDWETDEVLTTFD